MRSQANLLYNVLGSILPLLTTLVTVPVYIKVIGLERYGILSIAWILLGYLGFLDLGLSRAAANALAQSASPPDNERAKILTTVLMINTMLGAIGGLLTCIGGLFFVGYFVHDGATSLKAETIATIPWVASLVPIALIGGIAGGALESRDRFLIANVTQVVGSTFVQLVPLLFAIFYAPNLYIVVPTLVITRYVTASISLIIAFYPEDLVRRWTFDWARAKALFSYGGWVSVTSIIGPILTSIDQMIIASVLGPAAVTHYSVPMSLATRTQVLAASLSRTLFPKLSRLTQSEARHLSEEAALSLAHAYVILCAPAMLLAHPFLIVWLGNAFASTSAPIAIVLMLGAWLNGLAFLPFTFLQGQGHPEIPAKFHALELIPFVAILWISVKFFGLPGAAFAWTLRCAIDTALLIYAVKYDSARFIMLIPPTCLICVAFSVGYFVPLSNMASLVIGTFLGVLAIISACAFDLRLRRIAVTAVSTIYPQASTLWKAQSK